MVMSSANRYRCSPGLKINSGERTRLACWRWRPGHRELLIILNARVSLGTLFEGSGFAAKVRERFTGEVQRAGQQNGIWFCARQLKCFGKRWSDGVGE